MKSLIPILEKHLKLKINNYQNLTGGCISQVFQLQTNQGDFVIKINPTDEFDVLKSEAKGLATLSATKTLMIPAVYEVGKLADFSFLLMEYLPRGTEKSDTFKDFGKSLALLHQHRANEFGFEQDNYIGALVQSNKAYKQWSEFYWEERILPQYQMALKSNLIQEQNIPEREKFISVIENQISEVAPSLVHGDLWNGNYLIHASGKVALIDPAVSYSHPMMDIGMARLFGGFDATFFQAYYAHCDYTPNHEVEVELAQYYYLLVHLNLFGRSYLPQVQYIKSKYFD